MPAGFWPTGGNNQRDEIMQTIDERVDGGLMAAWLASGGAIEALNGTAAQAARSRRHAAAGDDGLHAGGYTMLYCATDDGLQGIVVTGIWCIDDGLQASGPTQVTAGSSCGRIDDGLAAGRVTGSPPICVDDGLRA